MMAQYMEVKNQYKDCILFYRLGDFYEMVFEDAEPGMKAAAAAGMDCVQVRRPSLS